jgi:CRP-like cAMP-binding protein
MTRALHLRKIPLLSDVAPETVARLAEVCEERIALPGEPLFAQGDPGDVLWILLEGEVSILVDGREVKRLGPGSAFGEIAVLDGGPRAAGARAQSDAYLLRLARPAFRALLEHDGELRWAVVRAAAELVLSIEGKVEELRDWPRRHRDVHAGGKTKIP